MTSPMASFLYSLALLPLLAAGDVPPPCNFPFIYKEKSYSECTNVDSSNETLWCATTASYNEHQQRKPCALNEYGGTSNGQPCVFPFIYKNQTYFTCTNEDHGDQRFWCATTGSYDERERWSYCADTRLNANPKGPCTFPFIYKGQSYLSCTTDGDSNGKLWCSLSKNYDQNPQWTYCEPSEHRPCTFPFVFNNESYSACTGDGGDDNILWCATTDNYDRDGKWKLCALQAYEGNSKGKPCVFPFTYGNQTYSTCTNENEEDGRFWCATTATYDSDKEWSYCADTAVSGRRSLRCQCIQTQSKMIPVRLIAEVKLTEKGPHCAVTEIIATMKNGRQICLDPNAKWVQLIVTAMLKRTENQPAQ
ncbi:epididymal sperm-binding protein 1-like [Elgaria multicarinata webbii]|uniref:epididymal sperm-binding protein 1-like n=1 Tax=Elgaria multicarinata webbii TaxID=159646 RepID=UPI002FCD34F2